MNNVGEDESAELDMFQSGILLEQESLDAIIYGVKEWFEGSYDVELLITGAARGGSISALKALLEAKINEQIQLEKDKITQRYIQSQKEARLSENLFDAAER